MAQIMNTWEAGRQYCSVLRSSVVIHEIWAASGMWPDIRQELYHHCIKLTSLYVPPAQIDELIRDLKAAGLPVPAELDAVVWHRAPETRPTKNLSASRGSGGGNGRCLSGKKDPPDKRKGSAMKTIANPGGGDGGIRTPGRFDPSTDFESASLRPLRYISICFKSSVLPLHVKFTIILYIEIPGPSMETF